MIKDLGIEENSNGKRTTIGMFKNIEDAAQARKDFVKSNNLIHKT